MMANLPMVPITVVIPVGPKLHHRAHFEELIESIRNQRTLPDEIIVINDGGEQISAWGKVHIYDGYLGSWEYRSPWNLGMVASWNSGVGLARNELVLLVGADDRLYGDCIHECYRAWKRELEPYGYYYLGVEYSDGRMQNTPCNAAMVTKTLWRHTGGFPPQAAVGAPDHIFLSMLLAATKAGLSPAKILQVCEDVLYWYRIGEQTETTKNIWPAIEAVKEYLHVNWRPQD